VAQYAFTFPNASGGADAAYLRYMFPAGDLLNHAGDSNAACGRDFRTGMLYAKATRAIRRAPRPRRFRGPAGGAPPGVACRAGDRGCPGRRGRAAEAARGRPPARLRGWRGRAGEEVTHTYDAGLERNDVALINHFFVQDLRPPRLCALDLPAGRLDGVLGAPDASYLPRLDDELEVRRARALPGAGARRQGRAPAARAVALHRRGAACGRAEGGYCAWAGTCLSAPLPGARPAPGVLCRRRPRTAACRHARAASAGSAARLSMRRAAAARQEEAARLEARLAGFPTSAAQDAELLGASGPAAPGPTAARVIEFRMLRKRALAHAAEALRVRLGRGGQLAAGGARHELWAAPSVRPEADCPQQQVTAVHSVSLSPDLAHWGADEVD